MVVEAVVPTQAVQVSWLKVTQVELGELPLMVTAAVEAAQVQSVQMLLAEIQMVVLVEQV